VGTINTSENDGIVVLEPNVVVVSTELGVVSIELGAFALRSTINDATITSQNLLSGLSTVEAQTQLGLLLSSLSLHNAHHRPLLLDTSIKEDNCVWLNGDFAQYRRDDATLKLAEFGACHDLSSKGVRVGLGLGKSYARQTLAFSGNSQLDGEYIIAELDYRIANTKWVASLTTFYGNWDATIDRGIQHRRWAWCVKWRDGHRIHRRAGSPGLAGCVQGLRCEHNAEVRTGHHQNGSRWIHRNGRELSRSI